MTDPRVSIVEAATRLLRDRGARAMTTRAVAEAAGVQAPTIYRLFGDKDGLIDAVAEHVMATYVEEKAATSGEPGDEPVQSLRTAWRRHIDFGLANPELYVLLNSPGREQRSPATAAGIDVLATLIHRLAAAGLLVVSEQRAVTMIHAAGTGTVLVLLEMPAEDRDPGVSDAMLEAAIQAILGSTPGRPSAGPLAVAVSFAAVLPQLPALSDAERTLLTEWVSRSIAASERS